MESLIYQYFIVTPVGDLIIITFIMKEELSEKNKLMLDGIKSTIV